MKISDKIHLLKIDFEITIGPEIKIPRFVNALLIFGDRITLVDSGIKGSEKIIFDYIEKQGRKAEEIENLILSHSHPDHIGSAAVIKNETDCNIIAHELEREWIEDIELQNRQRPVPGFFNLVDKPVIPDTIINRDNMIMKFQDDLTLKFIKASGHSKGSLNIYFIEDRILFTADSIPLKDDIPNYDNYIELMASLEKIKANRDYTTLLTSWTPALTDKNEIKRIISEGEDYMKKIDSAVKEYYWERDLDSMKNCGRVVEKLGLPPFLVNPIVDKAFRSHLSH